MTRPVPTSSVDESTERSSSKDSFDEFSTGETLLRSTTNSGEHVSPLDPGRYVIDEQDKAAMLGRGAQGVVWRAYDKVLRREVALKKMHASAQHDPGLVSMFVREARLTAMLEHPGIVPLHDLGRDAEGTLYLALRRIEGNILSETLDAAHGLDGRLALVPALVRACQAVAFAHEHGVVHRDLKPQNIMLGRFGETYVLDWGLALVEDRREGARPDVTAPNQATGVVGTPAYMSPEQALGLAADARSDVWGLGACLYHLLTGHPPIMGGSLQSAVKHASAGEVSPVLAVEPDAPRELAAICEKALSVERSGRYVNATALAADLEAWLAGRTVSARRYTAGELLWRAVKSNWRKVAIAVAALVTLAGVVTIDEWRIRKQRNEARLFVSRLMHDLPSQLDSSRHNVEVLNMLTSRSRQWLAREDLSIDELAEATDTLLVLAGANGDVGEWTPAAELYGQTFDLASRGRALAPGRPLFAARQIEAKAGLGYATFELGQSARAESEFEASQALLASWTGETTDEFRIARSELFTKWGNTLWSTESTRAQRYFIEAAEAATPVLTSGSARLRREASSRGANAVAALWAQGKHDAAYATAKLFYEAMERDCAAPEWADHRACLLPLSTYVGVLAWRGDAAYDALLEKLINAERILFNRQPDSVAMQYDSVVLFVEHGLYAEAAARARRLRQGDAAASGIEVGPLAAVLAGDLDEVDAWRPLAADAVTAGQLAFGLREAARGDYAAAARHVRAVDAARLWFDVSWTPHPRPALKLSPEAQPAFERFLTDFTKAYGLVDMKGIAGALQQLAADFDVLAVDGGVP